jgi:trimethylamine:corrinoid methyltransferase-like protein
MDNNKQLFDVFAINIKTGKKRLMATNKTEDNAEAFINMAICRRGVEEEFYKAFPAGTEKAD